MRGWESQWRVGTIRGVWWLGTWTRRKELATPNASSSSCADSPGEVQVLMSGLHTTKNKVKNRRGGDAQPATSQRNVYLLFPVCICYARGLGNAALWLVRLDVT